MKRDIVLKGIVTTALVLNMQFLPVGSLFGQCRVVSWNNTLNQTCMGELVNLSIENKKAIAKVKNIVV